MLEKGDKTLESLSYSKRESASSNSLVSAEKVEINDKGEINEKVDTNEKVEKVSKFNDRNLESLCYPIHESISYNSILSLEAESNFYDEVDSAVIKNVSPFCIKNKSSCTVLNTLIICDQPFIRLSVMYLLKDTFKIDNCFSVATNMKDATGILLEHKKKFDTLVIEKNLYLSLDDGQKEQWRALMNTRNRLVLMVSPDCEYEVENITSSHLNYDWCQQVTFPFPSALQLRAQLEKSKDPYIKMLSSMNEPRAVRQISADKIISILMVCSSLSSSKIMKKQLTTAIEEMGLKASIDLCPTALSALDLCCVSKVEGLYDIVIVDNALTLDMQACELIEFLRNQPSTNNSLIFTLTKSIITNTSILMEAGADIIWTKPLARKEVLIEKLSRLCKYKFISM
jgi:CheY-like chemotaxis protein